MEVYPRAAETPSATPLPDTTLASRIIEQREAGHTQALAVGAVLQGNDGVGAFYRVWGAVEAERLAMRAVVPGAFSTKTAYKAALSKVRVYLDVQQFADGVMAEAGATTWAGMAETE